MKYMKSLILVVTAICTLQANAQWVEVEWEQTFGISQMNFATDNVGYAYMHELQGFTSNFSKTSDGGQNWDPITLPVPLGTEFQSMDFYEDGEGVLIVRNWETGEVFTEVYQTSDDGENWQNISPDVVDPGYGISQIKFLNPSLGFFVSGQSFYGTSDGGENWITTVLPKAGISIDFVDEMNGVIGTWDDSFNYIGGMLTTTDGGLNWLETELTVNQTVIGKVIQLDETTAYAAPSEWGATGQQQFYKTTDNGLNWTPIEVPETINSAGLTGFDFRDEQNGVIALSNNDNLAMYATTDGGENWVLQNEFQNFYHSVFQLTPNSGYLVGQDGSIYRLEAALSTNDYTEAAFNTYPNPIGANQILRWDSKQPFSRATISDISGKEVFNTLISQAQSLQIPSLNRGIYFVSLENETAQHVVKIVIE